MGFLAAAVLVVAVLAGSPSVLRLLAPEAPVATLPAADIIAGIEGKATPTPAELETAMERGNAGRTGEVAGSGPTDKPDVRWRVPILDDHYFSPEAMVATNGSIIVTGWGDYLEDAEGTMAGYAFVIDAASGRERWRFRFEGPEAENYVSAPVVTGDTVYLGVSSQRVVVVTACPDEGCFGTPEPWPDNHETGFVVALDAATGVERWRVPTNGSASTSPIVAAGMLYVGSGDGTLLALDAQSGQQRWRWQATGEDAGAGAPWMGAPAAAGNTVFVVGENPPGDGALFALDAYAGTEQWQFSVAGAILSDPIATGETVFIEETTIYPRDRNVVGSGRETRQLHALDATTGAARWSVQRGGTLAVGDGLVFLLDQVDMAWSLTALDVGTGSEQWSVSGTFRDGSFAEPILSNGTLYLNMFDGNLFDPGPTGGDGPLDGIASAFGVGPETTVRALDAATGRDLWQFERTTAWGGLLAVDQNSIVVLELSTCW